MSEPTRTSVPEPDGVTRTAAPGGATDVGELLAPAGYELLAEIGSGGMGVVYRARDLDLARDVAVKILQPRYAPDSPTARRFVDEARITGRLQHPGIPAIYRVGTLADGRPFLAMKLIGGRTLDRILASGGQSRGQRSEDRGQKDTERDSGLTSDLERVAHGMFDRLDEVLRRGRFLAVFEQVAQAVGYAHQQGVIHRDLKPANVMVGDFGEVQVMDWGIARSGDRSREAGVGEGGNPAATVEYEPGSGFGTPQSDLTQAGAILGTPAFMPPEQAIGAVDQVGKHSDVFGLGAILCVILTGKPPYAAEDAESNRQLAARAKLDDCFTRLDGSGAEPELVALAKRCLAAEPKDRPRDAGEVASAVAALRADAERRARQAEMDRARAEVQVMEERKRRRVKRALAAAVIGLVAVAGVAAWWVDREQSQRRADQQARQLKEDAENQQKEAERKARQDAYERDVRAALDEVHSSLRVGREEAENLAGWLQMLIDASSAQERAFILLRRGEPTDSLQAEFDAASTAHLQDLRDYTLIVELDRAADSNEIRFLIPVSFTSVTSRQFASAFRTHGIDLLAVPTDQAVAWLKGHRLRNRLVIAIRNWQQSLPSWDVGTVVDVSLAEAVGASTAVAGVPVVAALGHDPNRQFEKFLRKTGPHAKLSAILKAVTDDPFTRKWWDAVEKKDAARLKELIRDPEIGRMTSRELSSLADGLNPYGTSEALGPLLAVAQERFPGEFWVHFRLSQLGDQAADPEKHGTHRHLTAALAIRPNSAIARVALGMELHEKKNDDPAGLRWLHSAAKADPTSPWPHLFIGMYAMESDDWPEAFRAMKECVRVDPDTGFFFISTAALFLLNGDKYDPKSPAEHDLVNFFNELIALQPRHPGGYDTLGNYYLQTGDHRAALALFRKARELVSPDYPGRSALEQEIARLEAEARWEEKLPAVLRGEIKPANAAEVAELASYCATFEKKFALATRFVIEGIEADPTLLDDLMEVAKFAGWAVQVSAGNGADAATVPLAVRERYRRLAFQWMRESVTRQGRDANSMGFYLDTIRDFAPVRNRKELARLPAAERAGWEQLWAEVTPIAVAPPPRRAKCP